MGRRVKSWDVFDTLLARRCVEPSAVFEYMEQNVAIPGFTKVRRLAEQTTQDATLPGIYRRLQELSGMPDQVRDALMGLELQAEQHQTFLIPETYNQVQDGDVLISDMYLDADSIMALLRAAGFKKDVKLYATPAGKAKGTIWQRVRADGYDIESHTGDNMHSDVVSAHRHGLVSRMYEGTKTTQWETLVRRHGFPTVARLMRATRLMNPFVPNSLDYLMWNEQAQINGPLLYLASMHVHHLLQTRDDIDHVLFPTRDAVHWHKLYRTLFPDDNARYYHASRSIYYQPTEAYLRYMRTLGDPSRALIADVFGSGRSSYAFFSEHMDALPMLYMLSSPAVGPTPELRAAMRVVTLFDNAPAAAMERLNYDMVGTLTDFTDDGPVRLPPTPEQRYLRTYHEAIACFVAEAARTPLESGAVGEDIYKAMMGLLVGAHTGAMISRLMPHDPDWYLRDPTVPVPAACPVDEAVPLSSVTSAATPLPEVPALAPVVSSAHPP